MEWDWDRPWPWWFCLGGRGERGGSSGGLKGSTRSISVRIGGGGMKSSSSSGGSISTASSSASSAFDKWSTIPAPNESPTTLMEVRILSLGGQTVSVSASDTATKSWITPKPLEPLTDVETEKALEKKSVGAIRHSYTLHLSDTWLTAASRRRWAGWCPE